MITKSKLRDKIAWTLCNWILNHIATEWYRKRIDGAIRYGLMAAVRDQNADRQSLS